MRTIILLSILFVVCLNSNAHKRAMYDIVIDTDGGVDDFRALTYFMASRDFNINAITTVDGVLSPHKTANYFRMLLDRYNHQGIQIGKGKLNNASKKYKNHALRQWQQVFPEMHEYDNFPKATDLLFEVIDNTPRATIFVAMGPLTNIAELIKEKPEVMLKVEMILWYCSFDDKPVGFNYQQDTAAYNYLMANNIPIKSLDAKGIKYNKDFPELIKHIDNSIYAKTFSEFITNFDKSYYWDDLLPIYLLFPTLFEEKRVFDNKIIVNPKPDAIFDILATGILNYDKPDEGVIFNEVPTSGFMIRSDLQNHIPEIISNHGYQEYKIVALTSEIHSHLGIYSIMGAKLGLRIMEYLHVGLDEVFIVTYAGSRPPVSCFNDGIQVGTGATIGYGKIKVANVETPEPRVKVIYNNREIMFTLKDEIVQDIRTTISGLVNKYGLDSEMYWTELRKIGIEYWKDICRFNAFKIEEL